jgi:lipopolysaccharide/colanic/teichoic acid biosynthesis glycosyltransferase
LAVLIYRESPGPVFFRQRRMGIRGQRFEMIKLRSMKLGADQGPRPGWTVKDDPRRLRIGKRMRSWNLDELPQFWNVLKGDMSLVGPRPEDVEVIREFKEVIPHYNARHHVKPGITGWAQVHGLRGDTDLVERIRHDLHYIEHWSLWLDFRIMVMTLLTRKGAC